MANIITSVGVFFILTAYIANSANKIEEGKLYFGLNIVGSFLAGIGAYQVQLWPIVILEIVWVMVSLYELKVHFKVQKKLKK
jgi:hypothetical protein